MSVSHSVSTTTTAYTRLHRRRQDLWAGRYRHLEEHAKLLAQANVARGPAPPGHPPPVQVLDPPY